MNRVPFGKILCAGIFVFLTIPAAMAAFHNESLAVLEKALKLIDSSEKESPRKFVLLDATFYTKSEFVAEANKKGQSSSSRSRYFKEILDEPSILEVKTMLNKKTKFWF